MSRRVKFKWKTPHKLQKHMADKAYRKIKPVLIAAMALINAGKTYKNLPSKKTLSERNQSCSTFQNRLIANSKNLDEQLIHALFPDAKCEQSDTTAFLQGKWVPTKYDELVALAEKFLNPNNGPEGDNVVTSSEVDLETKTIKKSHNPGDGDQFEVNNDAKTEAITREKVLDPPENSYPEVGDKADSVYEESTVSDTSLSPVLAKILFVTGMCLFSLSCYENDKWFMPALAIIGGFFNFSSLMMGAYGDPPTIGFSAGLFNTVVVEEGGNDASDHIVGSSNV